MELLLPNAREARDISPLVGVFYNMVRFSFKTQIYEKRLPQILAGRNKDMKSVLSQSVSDSGKQDNLSKIFASDSASIGKHEPCFLELLPTTKVYQKRLREL